MSSSDYDVVVVGGGASGMMAALTAADRGRRVLLIEKMDQAGRKLRITGKGRCNLTNTASLRDTLTHIGSDARFLRNAYARFFNRELMLFFEQRGVPLVEERGGRVFPASGKSLDVFLALIKSLEQHELVTIKKPVAVRRVETLATPDGVQTTGVVLANGSRIGCRQVILATGGLSYPTTGSTGAGVRMATETGHRVVDTVPSLVALKCAEPVLPDLVGFQLRNVQLRVTDGGHRELCRLFGEMTFLNDALAGPIVLSASRLVSRKLHDGEQLLATIDLKPALDVKQLDRRLLTDIDANGKRLFNDALRMWLPAELVPLALKSLHIEYYKRLHQISGDERRRLVAWLKAVPFTLVGTRDWNEAIVTQGGVALDQVDPRTMQSRLVKGLYFVGEMLDLDADTGGYNLQIAFSTGHAAGEAV